MYAKILPLPLDSESVSVLGSGNARQRAALNCIEENDLFACLAEFRGVLASTIALSIKELLASLELGRS